MKAPGAGFIPGRKRGHSIVESVFRKSLALYVLNTLTWAVGALVDGVVIGNHLGVDAIAAYGLIAPMTLVYGLIGAVFSGGSRNIYTHLAGHGKTEEANGVFTVSCAAAAAFSVLAIWITVAAAGPLAGLLGADGRNAHLRTLIVRYLEGFVIGLPFDSVARILAAYLPMDSDHRRSITATAAMTVTDIAGDLVAVFLLDGDMFLIGLTTAIGQAVYFAVLATHFLRKERMLRFRFREAGRAAARLGSVFVNGLPSALTRVFGCAAVVLTNRIISAAAASVYIAAFSISRTLSSLAGALYLGVADTVWMLSSVYYGEEDRNALNELQRAAYRIGSVLGVAATLVLLLFSRVVAALFVGFGNAEALAVCAEAIRFFALSIPLYVAVYIFDDYLMGTRKLLSANLYSYFLEFGAFVPIVWIMTRFFGGRGAWYAIPLSLLAMDLVSVFYVLFWKDGETFRDKRLLLRSGFGAKAGRELSISADSMTEVSGMSRLAKLFCEENGVDPKRAYKLALCIEELGSNIIRHGFPDGKPHSIDIRILVKADELILRIRDDCRPFNPAERYEMMGRREEADPAKNIGIRMVMQMSRDVQYLSTMGTNNLIIRI